MDIDYNRLRLEGVYKQNDEGQLMLRVKVPAGVLSVEQALKVCDISERFSSGVLHLTTRGSIEFHWLRYDDLAEIQRMLAAVGLTSRGACGGAVRGIVCSTTFSEQFSAAEQLARKLHRHFAGNPHFEGLPKKFKIGVDAGYGGSRHLIQDIGLVHVGSEEGEDRFDVWAAGGLGRQPIEGFLLERAVPERRLIPLVEAAVSVHREHTPPGRRLKHLVAEIGEERFRQLLAEQFGARAELEIFDGFDKGLAIRRGAATVRLEVPVFAGELETTAMRRLAEVARNHAGGFLALTADQDVVLLLADPAGEDAARQAVAEAGFASAADKVRFRICPGSHACRLGLAPTRDVAREVIAASTPALRERDWAISGCPNSCAQPQLASFGIVAVKSVKGEGGVRRPRFDLYRRDGEGFGQPLRQGVTTAELLQAVAELD